MITCEQFERDFKAYQSGDLPPELSRQLQEHVNRCSHCQAFGSTAYQLRELTASVRELKPSIQFQYRLRNRIRDLSGEDTQPAGAGNRLIPRWAAFGAGLATALTVSLIILYTPGSEVTTAPDVSFSNAPVAMSEEPPEPVDSVETAQDSTPVPEQPYNLDRHSQTVSSDR